MATLPTEDVRTGRAVDRAEAAIRLFGPERVMLTPDCGFATFADNPLASANIAEAKLHAIASAAQELRRRWING